MAVETLLDERLLVGGCEIAWGSWGDFGPPVTLIHGAGAHSGWWLGVVPELARTHRVAALDLSGHGDSGWRDRYRAEQWAAEAVEVASRHGAPHVLVGHSAGARIALVAAALYPDSIHKVLLVDPPVPPTPRSADRASGRRRWYPSRQAALESFGLLPPQPVADPGLVHRAALHSLREEEHGWTWKFDPRTFGHVADAVVVPYLPEVRCDVVLIRGEHTSVTTPEKAGALRALLGRTFPEIVIPGAHHHVPLDEPQRLAAAIAALV
ncbi:alpha/beta hydrolase [Dactylosporangium sucinum]|uniref:Alpha/beta hydrolase n=2 Tax=Dactylosporangium sucinum TaxID=1424081 RepID=A0A917U7U5_9ACTN|nr:alpha/beta hydrolase [Dactylosporangium sucinum]